MSATFIFLARAPALRILAPMIAGIIAGEYVNVRGNVVYITAGSLILALVLYRFIPAYIRFRWPVINGMIITLLIFFGGIILIRQVKVQSAPSWYGHQYRDGQQLLLRLDEPFVRRSKTNKTRATVIGRWQDRQLQKTTGSVWLYAAHGAIPDDYPVGNYIITKQIAQPVKNSGNPGAFDYVTYSRRQGVTGQLFIRDSMQVILIRDSSFSYKRKIVEWRKTILHQLKNYIAGKEEAGLAEALLVGYKEDLDEDLLRSYSNTGVVHVIAVSGMHLALIYWLIQKLLAPLAVVPRTKWISFFLVTGLLWLFSLIAGGAASIVRAAVMFTCLLLGQTLSRQSNIYNTLAVSALILLCFDPYWLWDAGFQLSYLAVLSIVIFYKPIYNLFYCRYRLIDWLWQLCAVTCAAQILTTPVSIYLFHQFPVCFLLTNLPVVPLSSVILIGEIGLLVVGFSSWLSGYAGLALSWMISLMNNIIYAIEKLPFAIWDNLNINMLQVLLLYLFIILIAWALMRKSVKALVWSLAVINIVAGIRYFDFKRASRREAMIVFNLPEGSKISFINGRKQWLQQDQPAAISMRNNIRPALCLYRTSLTDTLNDLQHRNNLVFYRGYRIIIADSSLKVRHIREPTATDLLLVRGTARDSAAIWLRKIEARQLVIDRRLSAKKRADWQAAAKEKGIAVHDMNEKGAFVLERSFR
jgi:competence protein ComEC